MERFTFFWKSHSPFSQWYPSSFVIDEITFRCAEQYMMYKKALLFGDSETAMKILDTSDPRVHKALGREVKNFDPKVWDENSRQVVYDGNYAKFVQNARILNTLKQTAGTTLVEASPWDTIWGIGLYASDHRAQNRATWRGENRLGEILTKLRKDLFNPCDKKSPASANRN